ncbi:MAG: POTRA domain-containing protein [Burkholderiaceae bacterium]
MPGRASSQFVQLKPGDVFSGSKLTETNKRISDKLGTLGYAFANVNAVPQIDREKRARSRSPDILIDRAVVRTSGASTSPATCARATRSSGASSASTRTPGTDADKIRLSRERLERLGYFTNVKIDNRRCPMRPDQVDLNVTVTERPTGNISLGIGVSSTEKLILSGSIVQPNFLGTGKSVALQLTTSWLARSVSRRPIRISRPTASAAASTSTRARSTRRN